MFFFFFMMSPQKIEIFMQTLIGPFLSRLNDNGTRFFL